MKRSWSDANDVEIDELEEQDAEDWSASTALILPPSSKDISHPYQAVPSSFGPVAHSEQIEHKRTIVHVDLDCFYAQVEMIRNPELRKKPLGIQQKNIVVTCNYIARDYGVRKLMYISDAKKMCPILVLVSGEDLTHYREYSQKVSDLLQSEFSSLVERLGFDENFVDVSSLVEERLKAYKGKPEIEVRGHRFGSGSEGAPSQCSCGCHQRLAMGSQIAAEMREKVKEEIGLTGCAGIAWNKLLAKLVGERHKPNDQTTLFPGEEQQLMIGLGNVRRIPGIGHSMNKKLATLGITTVVELQKASSNELERVFGSQNTVVMKNSSLGIDNSPVIKSGLPQTMSDEDSFKKCATVHDVMETMMNLLEKLFERLKKDGRVPQTIRLTVRKFCASQKWHRESRQTNLPSLVTSQIRKGVYSVSDSILEVLMGLFNKMVDTQKPFHLTLINICFASFGEKSSPGKSLDSYFSKDKKSSLEKEMKKSNIDSDKVSASLKAGGDKVISYQVTKEKKSSALENFFKKPKICEKDVETNGQQQRSFFHQKSAKMSSFKVPRDPNQELRVPNKNPRFESSSGMKGAVESDHQGTFKEATHNESPKISVCENVNKLVQVDESSDSKHGNNMVHNRGLKFVTGTEKQLHAPPGTSGENGLPLTECNASENCDRDTTVPIESIHQSPEPSSSSVGIPPDVDEAVFRSLPPYIQEELLKEWRAQSQQSVGLKSELNRKSLSKTSNSNKRITDFFAKS